MKIPENGVWGMNIFREGTLRQRCLTVGAALAVVAGGVLAVAPPSGAAIKLDAYQTIVANAEKPWSTWQGPTTPVTPPKHESLALVVCSGTVAGCVTPADAAARAAKSIGWTTTQYNGQGTPADQDTAITQAVNSGATAILLSGVDPSVVQSALQLAASKKIPVGDMTEGIAPGDGIKFDIGANYVKAGQVAGAWIVDASNGKAVVLPTNDKEYKSTVELVDGAVSEVKSCSSCKVLSQLYFVSTDIGSGLGQRVAEELQKNPSVNYMIGAYDPAVADMVPALQTAGIASRISIVSDVGDAQNLGYIQSGTVQKADIVFDNTYVGYAAIDQTIRVLDDKPLWKNAGVTDPRFEYNETVPYHLIVKSNLTAKDDSGWTESVNTIAHFDKLWGLK
jgi:ABC-type sugar transport system substrate-binding protein